MSKEDLKMGMEVLLRKNHIHSPFRHALLKLLRVKGEELFIKIGYVTMEIFNKNLNNYKTK